jgi:transcriptional regulator with XRE-family HTH domain
MPRQSVPVTLFGRRLRAARNRAGLPQDKLGVMIGLDEGTASARMSRYETGIHEPPFATAKSLGRVLKVPAAYFYCEDDLLAEFLTQYGVLDPKRQVQIARMASELCAQVA